MTNKELRGASSDAKQRDENSSRRLTRYFVIKKRTNMEDGAEQKSDDGGTAGNPLILLGISLSTLQHYP